MKLAWVVIALVSTAFSLGCRGEAKPKDTPETLQKLSDCDKAKQDKDAYIKDLEKRLADIELSGGGEEVVVTVTGDNLVIAGVKGKGPSGRAKIARGNAKDTELYEAFLKAVRMSRGKLKQCYQNALKKNSALQARSIPMAIRVQYRTDGKVSSAQFSPRVSADFDRCMKNVASGWTLPKMPKSVVFNSKITLTPE